MLLKVNNDQQQFATGRTFLDTAGTVAQTVFTVKNSAGAADGLAMQIGEVGQEKTEVMTLNGAPGDTLATADTAAKFDHPLDTPVYFYRYNQVIFLKSASGTAGTASAITDGTIGITPDSGFTSFEDTAAVSTDAWRTQFANDALSVTSSESDWIVSTDYPIYSLAGMRNRVKSKVNANIEDKSYNMWIGEWYEEMRNAAVQVNEEYMMGTVDLSYSGTTAEATITEDDFIGLNRVWMTTNGTNWYKSKMIRYNNIWPDQEFDPQAPRHYLRSDNVIGRLPHGSSGTARCAYSSLGTAMSDDGDELPYSMRGYTKSFIDYTLGQAYRHPSLHELNEAKRLEGNAKEAKAKFQVEITPRDRTGAEYIEIVDGSGLQDDWIG